MRQLNHIAGSVSLVCFSLGCLLAAGCQRSSDATVVGPPLAIEEAAIEEAAVAGLAAEKPGPGSGVTLQMLDYAGIEQLVASHLGKVVVMDAWAMSCPPCVQEFPKLVALSHQFGNDQLACISLSFDYQGIGQPADKLPRVTAFLQKQGATFDNVLASEESDSLYRKFHLASVPAVFVYDKSGTMRHRFDNVKAQSEAQHFTYADVERLVALLVAEPLEAEQPAAPTGSALSRSEQ